MKLFLLPIPILGYLFVGQIRIEDALMDLKTICAVLGVVVAGLWFIRGWMVKIEDKLKEGESRFNRFDEEAEKRASQLRSIEDKLNRLPCYDRLYCEVPRVNPKLTP